MNLIEIHSDGGCYPNPGNKYGSFEVLLNGKIILSRNRVQFGRGTNNEAEFQALQMALDETLSHLGAGGFDAKEFTLLIETDSTIVRNRLTKRNVIFKKSAESSSRMRDLACECLKVAIFFSSFKVEWKSREHNVERFGH